MNTIAIPLTDAVNAALTPQAVGTERRLRQLDLALAIGALAVMALPLGIAALCAKRSGAACVACAGAGGRGFERQTFVFGSGLTGRLFQSLGAARWPDLWHILKGDMAWVGPRPRTAAELGNAEQTWVRPGIVNSWFVRSRAAVAFGTEQDADEEDLRQRGVKRHLGLLARGLVAAFLPPTPAHASQQVRLCDVVFDNVDMNGALERLEQMLDQPRTQQVCFVNPACVNIAASHRGYRRTLNRAALVLPDGIGTKIASDILGSPLKQNVNGTDLFPRLMDLLARREGGIFLLGGQVGVAQQVALEIRSRWPQVRLCGVRDGFFAVAEEGEVAAEVRRSGADLLLVARGVPSQDLFIDRHLDAFGVKVAMGVGGLFDFVSGRIRRAPPWMREVGLEWLYRLLQEPGRMWRRYLVGNFSFLARVVLQRLRLRQFADDLEPVGNSGAAHQSSEPAAANTVRAVIFANAAVAGDLPVPRDFPAALLPVGHTSAIEYQIEQLAHAGIQQIDIVVCHGPELIRRRVEDGQRWGVTVRWHLAKDPERPYGVLGNETFGDAHRLVVTHADSWIPADILEQVVSSDRSVMAVDATGRSRWCGFASGTPEQFAALDPDMERNELALRLAARKALHLLVDESRCVPRLDAAGLLRSQQLASEGPQALALPLSWLPTPWGAMSPQALVHPSARIEGPVLIGPGCVVEAGAVLGPCTWLSRDVIVSDGTTLSRTLVLPKTYLGKDLELDQAIVSGARIRHLKHDVETTLPAADGVLLDLGREAGLGTSMFGQIAACAAVTLLLPLVALPLALRRLRGEPLPWVRRSVVVGRHELRAGPRMKRLRCLGTGHVGLAQVQGVLGVLLDVAQGRQAWFGVRARTSTQWYALRAEWQAMLCKAPVGLIHAPAWADNEAFRDDAEAVADVFHAARQGPSQNARLLASVCRSLWARKKQTSAPVARPVWREVS